MAPLFDQDSGPSGENRPAGGAPPTMAGHDDDGLRDQAADERPRYPDGAESTSPGPGPDQGAAQSDAVDGPDGAGSTVEPVATGDETGEGGPSSPAPIDASPEESIDAGGARGDSHAGIELDAGADERTGDSGGGAGQLEQDRTEPGTESAPPDTAEPAETQATADTAPAEAAALPAPDAEAAPEAGTENKPQADAEAETDGAAAAGADTMEAAAATPSEPSAMPLPPAPTLAAPRSEEAAPTAPPEPAPVGPPPSSPAEPVAAPSSAGPAPSHLASEPLAPVAVSDRVASQLKQLTRWPSPVRAHPDQRMSSLVMLVVLAVSIGAVGAGVLVALIFIIIGALGHG